MPRTGGDSISGKTRRGQRNKAQETEYKPIWLNLLVPVTLISLLGIFSAFFIFQINKPKITHLLVDDYSLSAQTDQDLRESHCIESSRHYTLGDQQIKIDFSERSEIVRELNIDSLIGPGKCSTIPKPSEELGLSEGTSLILALQNISREISSRIISGDSNNIVVTITIHKVEPGPNLPKMDSKGFEMIKESLEEIKRHGGIVKLIGAASKLQNKFSSELKGTEFEDKRIFEVCPKEDLQRCITEAFNSARKSKKTD